MKKFFRISGIVAGALLLIGVILITIGCLLGADGEFKLFNTVNFSTGIGKDNSVEKKYTPIDAFDTINVDMKYGEVSIVRGNEYAIEYVAAEDATYSVKNSVLSFTDTRKKDFKINFPFFRSWEKKFYVKIYVPENQMIDMNINADMGKIVISGVSGKIMDIEADMGDVEIDKASYETVIIGADMGNATFDGAVSREIKINISMGNCEVFGDLKCDMTIDADMGNVEVTTIYSSDSYTIMADCDMGKVNYNDKGGKKLDEKKSISVNCDMGNVDLNFRD